MSTPKFNGGEQRQSEGRRNPSQRRPTSAVLGFYGRLAAALAAGGVFAVLAYESPASAKRDSSKIAQTADRQDAVTEDGVLLPMNDRRARVAMEDAVGLARQKPRDSSRMTGDVVGERSSDGGWRSVARADQDEELRRHTTAAPHSRGPPGE